MRWVEFLILLLSAQAQTLQRLAVFFSEESLMEMLEEVGESFEIKPLVLDFNPERLQEIQPSSKEDESNDDEGFGLELPDPYQLLEGSVRELKLSPVFEFHLWSYPFYRLLIESGVDLNARVGTFPEDITHLLVNEIVKQAKDWLQRLPIRPEHSLPVEKAAMIPWLRFRSEVLKKMGQSPMIRL